MKKSRYDVFLLKNSLERQELEKDIMILNKKKSELLKLINDEDNKIITSGRFLKENKTVPAHMLKTYFDFEKKEDYFRQIKVVELSIEKMKKQYEVLEEKEKTIKELIENERKDLEKKKTKKLENEMIFFRKFNNR